MSQFPDELGAWWTDFPGSDKATWLTPSAPSLSPLAPAQEGVRGAVSRRALKHRLVVPAASGSGPGGKPRPSGGARP